VCDGTADAACPGQCLPDCTCPAISCGDCIVNGDEECDPCAASSVCGEHQTCNSECVCEPVPYCGDNIVNRPEEVCDGSDDAACPDKCTAECTCPPIVEESCWLTAGGVKFEPIVGLALARVNDNANGPNDSVGGVVAPSCSLEPSDGGQWTHIAHREKLHLDGKNISVVECSGGPTGSPECDVDTIEFRGDGTLKGIMGRKTLDDGTLLPMEVEFHVIAQDLNEPGNERANAGAGIDTYFLEITRPGTADVIYTIGPLTITGGNFQMHCSSCDN